MDKKCWLGGVVMLVLVGVLVAVDLRFGWGKAVAYSLGPILVAGYAVSFTCGWSGAIFALVINMLVTFYAFDTSQDVMLGRAVVSITSAAVGYSLIAFRSEKLWQSQRQLERTTERDKLLFELEANKRNDSLLRSYRLARDLADKAISLIKKSPALTLEEKTPIITCVDESLGIIAEKINVISIARQLVSDEEALGVEKPLLE